MDKAVIICGPTATGKTGLGIKLAQEFGGEIVSADSRQVYVGKNEEYGKDLPENSQYSISNIWWRDRFLKYYEVAGVRIWLYDVVDPGEEFNVSFWRECAELVIADILKRGKLPFVVGGTGLYIKALVQNLPNIYIKSDPLLRFKLAKMSKKELFEYLKKLNPQKVKSLNNSDKNNPRRLIRAIEIALCPSLKVREGLRVSYIQIGLTASKETLSQRIRDKIKVRGLSKDHERHEIEIMKKQLVWFKQQPEIKWYNLDDAKKD